MNTSRTDQVPAGTFQARLAVLPNGVERWVIASADNRLHPDGSLWLRSLVDAGRSPLTAKHYGTRVAKFLNWAGSTVDWHSVTLPELRMWMRTVAASPKRSPKTVALYMGAVYSFYRWADAGGLLTTDIVSKMTETRYFAPGSAGGGEYGRTKEVLVPELRPLSPSADEDWEWIEDAGARQRLVAAELNPRDRFMVDLLYFLGIRAGEALSLFKEDLHFGGGSTKLRCKLIDPHLHVRMGNPTENGARAKGAERTLFVPPRLIDRYVDYVIEKDAVLGKRDASRHVLVNLYTSDRYQGRAMSASGMRDVIARLSTQIDYPLSGPHVLRHTFATRLARGYECDAQPADVIQELLGHRDERSTQLYTHGLEAAKKAALESLQPRAFELLGLDE